MVCLRAKPSTPPGPTEGGFLIATLWESKEHSDRFVSEVLMASMPVEGGFSGRPEERTAEVVNLMTAWRS